jgi:signal transduction histidine kinase
MNIDLQFSVFKPTERLISTIEQTFHFDFCPRLQTHRELEEWLNARKFRDGTILFGEAAAVKATETWQLVLKAISESALLHIILTTSNNDLATATLKESHKQIYEIATDSQLASQALTDCYRNIRNGLELDYLKRSLTDLLSCYEMVYSNSVDQRHKIDTYMTHAREILRATALWVFDLQDVDTFVNVFSSGTGSVDRISKDAIEQLCEFKDSCTTVFVHNITQRLHHAMQPATASTFGVLSTFKLNGVPGFILYVFPSPSTTDIPWHACNFVSREIFHLLRCGLLRSQHDTLRALSQVHTMRQDLKEVIWDVLRHLKEHFRADGATLVQALEQQRDKIAFSKTYIHYSRKDEDIFEASEGFAYYCITNRKALLISALTDEGGDRLGIGFEYSPDRVRPDGSHLIKLRSVMAPKTIERERCIMYVPLVIGTEIHAALKIANFSQLRPFSLHDLQSLALFAGSVAGLLVNLHAIDRLQRENHRMRDEHKIIEKAEALFFYREIALGIFHQLANHIDDLSASMSLIESPLAKGKETSTQQVTAVISESQHRAAQAKRLISDANKRGHAMRPVATKCLLLQDVIRPVLEHAKKRSEGTEIKIIHSLTNQEFEVLLDPQLAQESFINLVDNARHAIKQHKAAGKREIFIAVRGDVQKKLIRIAVVDSGIGMDRDILAQVATFSPFFTTRHNGTGLGLYFAKKLFEQFGGSISIARTEAGKGTTMLVVVPMIKEGV